jgi:hydrogenase maturation protein HypF
MMRERLKIEIHGAVQGVGFRPFVYRLATGLRLGGWVINDARGVFIEVEGPQDDLNLFLSRVASEGPPRAVIHSLDANRLAPAGYDHFEIRHSDEHGTKTAVVLPDIATCSDCLAELFDPSNRRFRYPFTNCTNCGPRLTIVRALPYDRPNTTMRGFALCPTCRAEYEQPLDRRFHAQPNACPVCGPRLELWEPRTRGITEPQNCGTADPAHLVPVRPGHRVAAEGDDALRAAAEALRAGKIVAVKGLGGFHLMCDARSIHAVARLRERKRREEKPLALMARDLAQVAGFCEVLPEADALLASPEAPIVLLRRSPSRIAANVAPGNPYLGVMLPATPLHHLLLQEIGFPVVATSGNLSDEPICTDEYEALDRLGGIADVFLVHNRPIERHVDDSIAAIICGAPRLLRRARGYAPLPVLLRQEAPCILAVGAHLKNTVALSVGRQVFISQHIGDLEMPQALGAFERVIGDFLRLYGAQPVVIAHDLHPDYASTRYAQELGNQLPSASSIASSTPNPQSPIPNPRPPTPDPRPLIPVQHHHAHLAACLAENGASGPALGVTWDGTGYGTDGTIWGGEFLLGDAASFERVAHLRPFRLPSGEAAIRQPARIALALLWDLYGPTVLEMGDLPPLRVFRQDELRVLAQMLRRDINTPVTTSAGRLFDGIAALLGLSRHVAFEGQAAMQLEWAADPTVTQAYPVEWYRADAQEETGSGVGAFPLVLDWRSLVEMAVTDVQRGTSPGVMAARFHNALVESIAVVAHSVGTPRVALTGGCFQNRLLVERAAARLGEAGFDVLLHRQVPPGDGGISLGQVAVAAVRLMGGG